MRYIILLLFLSGCTVPAFGAFPDIGAKKACQESLTEIERHWDDCKIEARQSPEELQQLWDDCDHAVSATLRPISASAMDECLNAIDMVSCDHLDQSNPPDCMKLFFHP